VESEFSTLWNLRDAIFVVIEISTTGGSMAKFMVLYSGGKSPATSTPQEVEASMKEWMKWFEGMGKSVVDHGAPFTGSRTLSSSGNQDGASGNVSNGYSVIEAADIAAAATLLKSCPIIAEGGKVHVFGLAAM
jgi:hypothetical protein